MMATANKTMPRVPVTLPEKYKPTATTATSRRMPLSAVPILLFILLNFLQS